MRIVFSPEAQLEFEEAERYDQRQATHLDKEFRPEVRNSLSRLRNWPLSCALEIGEI